MTPPFSLCFASNNAHKLNEIRPLLPAGLRLLSLADIGCHEELPETQDTLVGNALQKAQYVCDHYHVACFADDTGLEVEALGNAPGVYSARYAGPQRSAPDNVAKLLQELAPHPNRTARFSTVIALVKPEQVKLRPDVAPRPQAGNVIDYANGGYFEQLFFGKVSGLIAEAPRGTQGFGYDPVFVPAEGDGRTFAEMSGDEKNQLSHRARAVTGLRAFLHTIYGA
jgi:XTP/dITP diphosphohydrolase